MSTISKEGLNLGHRMRGWNIHSYGDPLQLSTIRIPVLSNPNDVLIKVEAASVNPIDRLMLGKYCSGVVSRFL